MGRIALTSYQTEPVSYVLDENKKAWDGGILRRSDGLRSGKRRKRRVGEKRQKLR